MALRSFLIRFATDGTGCRFPSACAVTAYDEQDALGLVRSSYAKDGELPPVSEMQVGVTFEEVAAQIGNADYGVPVVRGIWYPHLDNP